MAIPKTMKALVSYDKDDYRLELEYPTPVCGPDDIIIKTEACGICAGDLKCSHGAAMFWGDEVQPAVCSQTAHSRLYLPDARCNLH